MAIKAITPCAPFDFVPEGQEGEGAPVTFKCKGLDGLQQAQISPYVSIGDGGLMVTGDGLTMCLSFGLLGWENFQNDQGPVPFSRNMIENQKIMPIELQKRIAEAIIDASHVTKDAAKN